MSDYNTILNTFGLFKRAAIDAYMRSYDFHEFLTEFVIKEENNEYECSRALGNYTQRVTRPGVDGEGGGSSSSLDVEGHVIQSDAFQENFNTVRAQVNELKKWLDVPLVPGPFSVGPRGLPNPSEIHGMMKLSCEPLKYLVQEGGLYNETLLVPDFVIKNNLSAIKEKLSDMSGALVSNFRNNFVSNIETAIEGLHAIALLLGGSINAEMGIFAQARLDIPTLYDQTFATFNRIKDKQSASIGLSLNLLKIAVDCFAEFCGVDKLEKGAKLLGFGLSALDEVTSSGTEVKHDGLINYNTAYNAFIDGLNQINSGIVKAEGAVQQNLKSNFEFLSSRKELFDVRRESIEKKDETDRKGFKMSLKEVEDIHENLLPTIATRLDVVKENMEKVYLGPLVSRHPEIGVGFMGPDLEFQDVKIYFCDMASKVAEDIRVGAKDFESAAKELYEEDVRAGRDLKSLWED